MPVLPGQDYNLAGQQVALTFLHTADIHSRLLPYQYTPIKTDIDLGIIPEVGPFGGATRLASLLKRERGLSDRVVHIDAGDPFQGAPIFNLNTGEVEFRWLSLVHVNAMAIGNHEYDAGPQNFVNRARDFASFPLLAANYVWESPAGLDNYGSALYTAPYTVQNIKGLKVGIVGMANVSTMTSLVEGGNSIQATPYEQNEAARAYVDLLRPAVDVVVVLSHLGLTEDQELINGYDAYYEYWKIKSFVERDPDRDPWRVLESFLPPGVTWDTATDAQKDAAVVRVWIPGVSGVDVVFGGHLHVVLNPPQVLRDPSGRNVLLAHSGSFAKFLARLDTVVQVPKGDEPADVLINGAEILSHDYKVWPVDGLWCDDALHAYWNDNFWDPGVFPKDPKVMEGVARCASQENLDTIQLLQPYILGLDYSLQLTSIFAYTPRDIARRNSSSGGDSPLGNIAADSMRKRARVEAEVALTNTLGIRDNLYAGPLTQEAMFNVFPFENTINIMYLSGTEMQELFDFATEKSADRGCQAQAQISGARFQMDCAQVQLNEIRYPCDPANGGADCPTDDRDGRWPWQCLEDLAGARCWAHSANDITVNGAPLDKYGVYKIAVNDYIAKGGSGFAVLKRNTTRIETGIPLRDSLIGYMKNFCSCEEILSGPEPVGESGQPCGVLIDGHYVVEQQILSFCNSTVAFQALATKHVDGKPAGCTCASVAANDTAACGQILDDALSQCVPFMTDPPTLTGPTVGRCSCLDVLKNDEVLCGPITAQTRAFCARPDKMAVAIGMEDGRISRRIK